LAYATLEGWSSVWPPKVMITLPPSKIWSPEEHELYKRMLLQEQEVYRDEGTFSPPELKDPEKFLDYRFWRKAHIEDPRNQAYLRYQAAKVAPEASVDDSLSSEDVSRQ
jgi:hypothetical protein